MLKNSYLKKKSDNCTVCYKFLIAHFIQMQIKHVNFTNKFQHCEYMIDFPLDE